ncbi:MAG: MoxR family ATPase [Candidatus Accumulibacter delftensis]|jgi:MoxR-like ATPase
METDVRELLKNLKTDAVERFDDIVHQWSQNEIDALHLALASGRPLLVRGEPGTGKTQLALAAARALDWRLECVTISPRFEAQDLFYRFDAVQRLADAQAAGVAGGGVKPDHCYWLPGPFWLAFAWDDALGYGPQSAAVKQYVGDGSEASPGSHSAGAPASAAAKPAGHVILIDEIDKADSDLPNSLLEVLGSREFPNPVTRQPIKPGDGLPLVVITTNEERELPAAFLRRCVVLTLEPDDPYADFLVKRGQAHFGTAAPSARRLHETILRMAAEQLDADRHNARMAGVPPPGLAEYIDLLTALCRLAPGKRDEQKLGWRGWRRTLSSRTESSTAVRSCRRSEPPSEQASRRRNEALALAGAGRSVARAGACRRRRGQTAPLRGLLGFEHQPVVATISGVISPVGAACFVGPAPAPAEVEAREPLRAPLFAITACQRLELPGRTTPTDDRSPADAGAMRAAAQRRRSGALRSAGSPRAAVAGAQALGGRNAARRARHAAPAARTGRRPTAAPLAAPSPIPLGRRTARRLGSRRTPAAYQEDFQAIVTDLLRQRGAGGFTLWLVDGSPQQVRQRWPEKPAHAGRGCASARGHCHAGAGNAGAAPLRRRRAGRAAGDASVGRICPRTCRSTARSPSSGRRWRRARSRSS